LEASVAFATEPAGQPEPAYVKLLMKTSLGSGTVVGVGVARPRVAAATTRRVLKYIIDEVVMIKPGVFCRCV